MPALFDQEDDLYALHVAKADKKSDVLANEDIHNDQGALVFKAGSRIGASEVERLLKFKLSKPLENSIAISNQLTAHSLYEELMRLIKADAQLMQLHTLCDIDNDIRECCAYFQRFEVIRQKLSILSLNLPNVFESALLAAWLGVVIAQRMNLAASVQSLFIAGLCRDIGFLHLHPELLFSDNLDPAQVRQIQAHPAIAAAALSDIKGLGSDISVMVMNHHERADGSGYPKGISEKDMLLPSQILCIADFVCEVYLARLRLHRRSLRDLLPILQIGSKAHADRCYNTLIMAIRRLQLPTNTTLHQHHAQAFIDQLMDNDRLLAKKVAILEKVVVSIGFTHGNNHINIMQNMFLQISLNLNGAGILDAGYIRWLEFIKVDAQDWALREAEDVWLMIEEANLIIANIVLRMQKLLLHDCKDTAISKILSAGINMLNNLPRNEAESIS